MLSRFVALSVSLIAKVSLLQFMVQYKEGEDLGLDMHTDDADVTFNMCLGREFEASGLTFCGGVGRSDHRQFSCCYKHVKGWAVVHLGTQRHGADDIASGERNNLIVWCHNWAFRASAGHQMHERRYEKEGARPDPRCLSVTHDRDYMQWAHPQGAAEAERVSERNAKGWCPPRGAAWDD